MSDEELIARLRSINKNYELARGVHVDIRQAADRIEALTKERDDYAHKLMQANNTYTEMHLEIERLSDKLAKVVAAAEELSAAFYSDGNVTERHLRACKAGVKLNATLAEIKAT